MAETKTVKKLSINDYEFACVTNTCTSEMLKDISKHSNAITTALSSIAKNYEKVIFNLYWIYRTKSYLSFGYDSILTYASEKFGFKKSSTYDFLNLAERFGNDKFDAFDNKYKDYTHSKLSLIADKSDSEIDDMKINPDMSVKEIKSLVKKHDSSSNSFQDSVDNEPGSYPEKPDLQESLVIKENNEVFLSESVDITDYSSFKPNECFDLLNKESYGWAFAQVVNDYLDNHMFVDSGLVTYEEKQVINVPANIGFLGYTAVFFDDKFVVRFFWNKVVIDVALKRLEREKFQRIGYLIIVYQGEINKRLLPIKKEVYGFIDMDVINNYFIKYPDCKITITLNNSNDNKEEGGKDV